MKTTEEWLDEVTHHFDDGKVVRSLLKKDIEAIQLDAAKRGMEIAETKSQMVENPFALSSNRAATIMRNKICFVILAARVSLKQSDL